MTNITVYSKPDCVQCDRTYFVLDRAKTEYDVKDLSEDSNALAVVKSLNYLAAPVVVVRDDAGDMVEHWSGFRPDLLSKHI